MEKDKDEITEDNVQYFQAMIAQLKELKEKIGRGNEEVETTLPDVSAILSRLEEHNTIASDPDTRVEMVIAMVELGDLLDVCFERDKKAQYIKSVVQCRSTALKVASQDDLTAPFVGILALRLGSCYYSRFKVLGELKDIDNAIEYQSQAIGLAPAGHANMPMWLNNLGLSYQIRFECLGRIEDIRKAIGYQSEAILLTPAGHEDMPTWLNNLGRSYQARFDHLGHVEDIEKAIEYQSKAISLADGGHEDMAMWLNNLGISHQGRFECLGKIEDLEKAIDHQSQAVLLSHNGDAAMALWLANLGSSHQSRFERLGKVEDLEKAIEYKSQAISLTPAGHVNLPARLNNLGRSYQSRFERFGKMEDIEKAIEFQTQGVSLTSETHPDMPAFLSNLGRSHKSLFGRLGKVEDLEKAIKYQSQAVSLTPKEHSKLAMWLNNLGTSYQARFEHFGEVQDLGKAIEYQSQAVSLTSDGHANMPIWLSNLGTTHHTRFEHLEKVEDLEKAIEYQSRAVLLTPEGHADIPTWLNNLGISHQSRFDLLGKAEDIEKAIEYQSRAVSLTPGGHADMCLRLKNLGISYRQQYQHLNSSEALARSIEYFHRSAFFLTGHPHQRFRAALQWVKLAPLISTSETLLAFQTAIDLVPHVVWIGETISQRYGDIRQIGTLATQAAAAAISAGKYDRALEWLEQGRSVVWNQTLQLRTPFDELSSVNPVLAVKLQQVAFELHNAASRSSFQFSQLGNELPPEQVAQRHHRLAEQYEELINDIRSIDGFRDFLRPKKASELLQAAQTGPIVIVNVHESRCDALVLHPGATEVQYVPLPNLSHSGVAAARTKLDRSLQLQDLRERGAVRRPDRIAHQAKSQLDPFEELLSMLWSDITEPVLGYLGYLKLPIPETMPHVTWCTTGPLSFLPLHASGLYREQQARVFNFVISSYIPTLTALLAAAASAPKMHHRMLAIGQEATPGHARLPGTKSELASIQKYVQPPNHYNQVVGGDATIASVLAAMEMSDWVHFACHAHQDVLDPTESGFLLHDDMLNLASIMQKSLGNKGLAFLSACQTATGDRDRPDESVHLASGMLLAGYPSVIATMWSVKDQDAPMVADRVYGLLMKDGKMDYRGAAAALHAAAGELRAQVGERKFGRWLPYIHIGI